MSSPTEFIVPSSSVSPPKDGTKKYNAGTNKVGGPQNAGKMESNPDFVPKTITVEKARELVDARTSRGMTQKEVAAKANILLSVYQEYENGKAVTSKASYSAEYARIRKVLGLNSKKAPK